VKISFFGNQKSKFFWCNPNKLRKQPHDAGIKIKNKIALCLRTVFVKKIFLENTFSQAYYIFLKGSFHTLS